MSGGSGLSWLHSLQVCALLHLSTGSLAPVGSNAGAKGAGAGTWCRPGHRLWQSQHSQSSWPFLICYLCKWQQWWLPSSNLDAIPGLTWLHPSQLRTPLCTGSPHLKCRATPWSWHVNKGLSCQSYGFSSSHAWMWELDYKESWAPKNWCFWTVVLQKTLQSPLDCKEIQPVHPKGDQSWVFIGGTDVEAETPILWPPDGKNWLTGKDPDAGKDWRQEERGMTEDEMVWWHHQLDGHELEQAMGVGDGQGSLVCCSPWGRKESDTTEWLNWTEHYGASGTRVDAWLRLGHVQGWSQETG